MDNFQEKKKISTLKKYLKTFRPLFVVAIFVFLFLGQVSVAKAASLFISPSSGNYEIGKTFSVSILVSSPNQAMNAASGHVSFPADKLEVSAISKSGSIFSLWAQDPSFSNTAGSVNFEGIIMNPGFSGNNGKIITITFKTKAAGQASISFSSGSVLANDGLGTSILNSLAGAKINISAPEIPAAPVVKEEPPKPVSPEPEKTPTVKNNDVPAAPQVSSITNPDQQKWYANKNIEVSWNLPAGVNGESVYFSQSPESNLASVSDGLFTSKSYENVEDGIWYFHIKFRNQNGWGETTHFRLQVDTTGPKPFNIEIIEGKNGESSRVKLSSDVVDDLAGLDYYTISYDLQAPIRLTSTEIGVNTLYDLPALEPGNRQIKLTAYDKAGNSSSAISEFVVSVAISSESKPAILTPTMAPPQPKNIESANPQSDIFGLGDKFYEAGSWIIRALIVLIPIFALLLLLVFLFRYAWHKFSRLNIKAAEEVRLAKKSFQKELAKSKKDIQARIIILENNRARRQKVEEAERKILENLQQDLANLEKPSKVIKVPIVKKIRKK